MIIALVGALAAAAEPCAQPSRAAEVASTLQQAMVSYAELEEDAFKASADRALKLVGCLAEPMTPTLAAQLHRVVGVRQILLGDEPGGREALAASARIEPGFKLSETIAPAGTSLDVAWKAAVAQGPAVRVPFGAPVTATVDGTSAVDRPQNGPYVLQVEQAGGTIAFSTWVSTGWPALPPALGGSATPAPAPVAAAPVPVAPAPVAAAPAPAPAPSTASSGGGGGKGFLVSGLISGGLAAGLYGGAVGSRLAYENNPTAGGYTMTNGAVYGSIGTAVLSAGLLSIHIATR